MVFVFVFSQNCTTTIASGIGFVFAVIACSLIVWIFLMRIQAESRRARIDAKFQKWETMLFESLDNSNTQKLNSQEDSEVNRVQRDKNTEKLKNFIEKDVAQFLILWNYIQESIRGESKRRLDKLSRELELSEKAQVLLKKRKVENKIIGIVTLGNLMETDSWQALEKYAFDKDPIVSLSAVTALFRIDREKAKINYFSLFAEREDWTPVFVAKLFKELSPDFISKPLTELIARVYSSSFDEFQLARLISYLAFAHASDYDALVNRILKESNRQEIIIACLRLVNSQEMLSRIRELVKDQRWQVRMHAVLALSRLGGEDDLETLLMALNDTEWWVRYRAAFAISSMPFVTKQYLVKLSKNLPNEFSRDIINQVLAETQLQCLIQPSYNTLSRQ